MPTGPTSTSRKKFRRANVQWHAGAELSAVWAAYVVATGAACTDPKTEAVLIGPIADINNRFLSASIDVGVFWKNYVAQRMDDCDLSESATTALLAAGCHEMQLDQMANVVKKRLADARAAFSGRYPKLNEQLVLRGRPLRERWDTYGEGLLRGVERQIWNNSPPDDWWPTRTSGWLVQPLVGGDGHHDGSNEKFWIEAMLTDADPAVPEVLRVAWLVTQIAIEKHTRQRSSDTALLAAWQYASIPLVLAAAADVELVRGPELPIGRAMELWKFGDAAAADKLTRWWKEFTEAPTPLPVALRKLAV
ncbi:hypothetical protein K227x_29240 [Rubripirellula lacrimiformis]|uniref:Uncharacterized protein n=1 Tax=Rubripirellula lacrimiformis TaxID=1930273 RepID=A0A517NBL9_9BACT|nr:hypothetical protein [Rubripirellula lacrimiformis]QDT04532.1 hypothetical protein K227x_29240 [Rubripirellula lacrimiformis]